MGYQCTECDEEFDDEGDLNMHVTFGCCSHMEENEDGTFKCDICNQMFEEASDLGMHIMWGHKKGKLTGKNDTQYQQWLKNPEFDGIRKAIDEYQPVKV